MVCFGACRPASREFLCGYFGRDVENLCGNVVWNVGCDGGAMEVGSWWDERMGGNKWVMLHRSSNTRLDPGAARWVIPGDRSSVVDFKFRRGNLMCAIAGYARNSTLASSEGWAGWSNLGTSAIAQR